MEDNEGEVVLVVLLVCLTFKMEVKDWSKGFLGGVCVGSLEFVFVMVGVVLVWVVTVTVFDTIVLLLWETMPFFKDDLFFFLDDFVMEVEVEVDVDVEMDGVVLEGGVGVDGRLFLC